MAFGSMVIFTILILSIHEHGMCFHLFVLSRSEEHTSELQSRLHLVCRLLLEKKNGSSLTIPGRCPRQQVEAVSSCADSLTGAAASLCPYSITGGTSPCGVWLTLQGHPMCGGS